MASEGEKLPLGGMVPAVPLGTEIPPEPPEVAARTLAVGARLLVGGTVFFFLSFVFSYFYLRSLNVEGMWRPKHVHPDKGLGAAMAACIVVSALLSIVGGRRLKAGSRAWTGLVAGGVAFGLAAVALQCIEYTSQKFGPTDGAYASVFVGWTGLYLIAVLFTMYWLETHVATELRARRDPAATTPEADIKEADLLIAPGLDAAVFYWSFLAGVGVLMWVILYLI